MPTGGKPTFSLKSVTVAEVTKMISALKNGHAYGKYGNDEIDSFIVKLAAPVIAPAITHVINLSIGTAHFPQKRKIA